MTRSELNARIRSVRDLFLTDRAVRYLLLARIFGFVVGPLTLLSVGTFLKPEEQGVYYVFGSLLQLGAFIDLGFSRSAQQVLAHAFGSLGANRMEGFTGDDERRARFLATAKAVLRIYALLGIASMLLLGLAGHLYLEKSLRDTHLDPIAPWWAMAASIGFGFGLQSVVTIADSANLLPLTNKWRFIAEVSGLLVFLATLGAGGGLWASAALSWTRYLLTIVPVAFALGARAWKQIRASKSSDFNYRVEILPLQVRNMISYGMGFLIFYCYTPITLSLSGPVTAGLVGMSIQISNIAMSFGILWINAQIPLMGNLAGSGSREQLAGLHSKGTRITAISWILVSAGIVAAAALGKILLPSLGGRYGTTADITLFIVGSGGMVWAHVRGAYIRAYRVEPFALLSVVQAIATILLLLLAVPRSGVTGAAICYASTMLFGAAWVELTVRRFKDGRHRLSHLQTI